jgi:hypothetical protein
MLILTGGLAVSTAQTRYPNRATANSTDIAKCLLDGRCIIGYPVAHRVMRCHFQIFCALHTHFFHL